MRFSIAPVFVFAGLASQSLANVFITHPVATDVVPAGQPFLIQWQLNSESPADLGFADVGLYVGSVNVQEQVAQLATSVPTANVTSVNVTVPPTAGENFNAYFIRFTSLSVQAGNGSQFFAEAFSALFTMSGMTGQFSPAEQNAINIAKTNSSAAVAGASSPSGPSASTPLANSSPSKSASNSSSSTTAVTTSKTSTKPSQSASGAISTGVNMALVGAFLLSGAGLLL